MMVQKMKNLGRSKQGLNKSNYDLSSTSMKIVGAKPPIPRLESSECIPIYLYEPYQRLPIEHMN
jgi:hypothetical protein